MKLKIVLLASLVFSMAPLVRGNPTPATQFSFVGKAPGEGEPRWMVWLSTSEAWLYTRSALWRTSNGGVNWESTALPGVGRARFAVDDLQAFHERAFILSNNAVFRTADPSRGWLPLRELPLGEFGGELRGMHFIDASRGWIFGAVYRRAKPGEVVPNSARSVREDGVILALSPAVFFTQDAGEHWSRQQLPVVTAAMLGFRIVGMASFGDHAFSAGEFGIAHTGDIGRSWKMGRIEARSGELQRSLSESSTQIRRVLAFDDQNGWFSPDDGSLYRTENAGAIWRRILPKGSIRSQYSPQPSYFEAMLFESPTLGWAVELSGGLLETTDGGVGWRNISPANARFESLFHFDDNHVWALADIGMYRLVSQ